MIPNEITRDHVLKALDEIDVNGVPPERESTVWLLKHDGKVYPPKYVISIAGKYALGHEHSHEEFSGGPRANNFLINRGFEIIPKRRVEDGLGINLTAYSWTIEGPNRAAKVLDKSSFLHRGTGIPKDICFFFLADELSGGEKRPISLVHIGKSYSAHIDREAQDTARTQLLWKSDLASLLRATFPFHYQQYKAGKEPEHNAILHLERLEGFESYLMSLTGEVPVANNDSNPEIASSVCLRPLILYEDYERKEVHEILAPDDKFTKSSGTWGIQGPIELKERPGDFVFFVTLGKVQHTGNTYDDGLTRDGVLSWDTQAKQNFTTPSVKKWINHKSSANTIYLFLRVSDAKPYTYLGKLDYLTHDKERQNPVHFKWQILDWDIPGAVVARMGLRFQGTPQVEVIPSEKVNTLLLCPPPKPSSRSGVTTSWFKGKKDVDYSQKDEKNRKLGRLGELLVIEYEKNTLKNIGRSDLADRIRHVADVEGDGAGYDVESYDEDGNKKFIEVKTTKGGPNTSFYISSNELAFAATHSNCFYLYRVYEFNEDFNSGRLFITPNPVTKNLKLTPVNYRAEF